MFRQSSFVVSVQKVYSSTLVPTKTPGLVKCSDSRASDVSLDDPPTQSWWKHKHFCFQQGSVWKRVCVIFSEEKEAKRRTGCLVAAGSTDDACPNHRTLVLRKFILCLLQAPCPFTFIFMIYSQLFQISPGLCLCYSVGLH